MVGWSSLLDWPGRSMVVVEVGEAIASGFPGKGKSVLPFPLGAMGNPLVGFPTKVRCGGRCPTEGGPHGSGARAIPKGGEAQAIETIGYELKASKANGFTEGKVITQQTLAAGSSDERR
jgi:hypothetical protein